MYVPLPRPGDRAPPKIDIPDINPSLTITWPQPGTSETAAIGAPAKPRPGHTGQTATRAHRPNRDPGTPAKPRPGHTGQTATRAHRPNRDPGTPAKPRPGHTGQTATR